MSDISRSQLIAYAALAVVIGLLGARYARGAGNASPGGATAGYASSRGGAGGGASRSSGVSATFTAGGRSAVVHVAGAVRRPGVYELSAGARVQDAIRRAGGGKRRANLDAVNLAARLVDGEQVVVPNRGTQAPGAATATAASGSSATPAAPVSLGSATLEQLQTLDGVGPATASKIVAYRQQHGGFRSVDDLVNVPGIGPKKLAAMKPGLQP